MFGEMAHSPRYEARTAWPDLLASVDALCTELKTAPPVARRKALAAVARALWEPPGAKRLPLVQVVLGELRKAAGRHLPERISPSCPHADAYTAHRGGAARVVSGGVGVSGRVE